MPSHRIKTHANVGTRYPKGFSKHLQVVASIDSGKKIGRESVTLINNEDK